MGPPRESPLGKPRPTADAVDRVALALERALGSGRVLRGEAVLDRCARDESGLGVFPPDLVVKPCSAAEVAAVLRAASAAGVPVTPRGGGTGRVGGALPVHGGIVLAMEDMNRIVRIERDNFLARVEPGVVLAALHSAVEDAGLFYPPDPSSLDSCTLGGNVACNAGGPRALKYGSTAAFVLGVEVVLPSGEILETGRNTPKGGAGYELQKLLTGSEGTLGVITAVTCRLVARPASVMTALVTFPGTRAACGATVALLHSGVTPRSIELLDRASLAAARTRAVRHVPPGAGAALIVEVDGRDAEDVERSMPVVAACCEAHGAQQVLIAQDEAQRRDLWQARRELGPALKQAHPCRIAEDVVVPVGRLADTLERAEEIGARHGVGIATFGHAGDGNVHVNVLFDEVTRRAADAAAAEILGAVVAFGGTVAGEHGTGLQKAGALALEQSAELLELQRRVKRVFDPAGIMNPGKF